MKKMSKKILASALALAMTVAGSVVTFADPNAPMAEPSQDVVVEADGTITVTVSAKGDFEPGFDYGIAYDSTKVEVADFNVDSAFAEFLANGQGINTSNLFADQAYVVLGGVTTNKNKLGKDVETTYEGVVGFVKFTVLEGQKAEDAKFSVVKNSADAGKALEAGTTLLQAVETGKVEGALTPETPKAPETTPEVTPETTPETTPVTTPDGGAGTDDGDKKVEETKAPATTTAAAKTTAATTAAAKKTSPKTGDAGVVLPIVAICGAAAAVAVASKKRVED